ncbi:MAG: aldehyde dehydrogenase family protein [Bacteroidales bacterium]
MAGEKILSGGNTDPDDLYIEPTLLDNPDKENHVMKHGIFGPILPVIPYETEQEIHDCISSYEKPLAFYIFSNHVKFIKRLIALHSFGGVLLTIPSFILPTIVFRSEELATAA